MSEGLDLNAIRARADAATEGPWYATEDLALDGDEAAVGVARGEFGASDYAMVVTTPGDASYDAGDFPTSRVADAVFIAHARSDVPALVGEVEHLRAELAAILESADDLGTCAYYLRGLEGEDVAGTCSFFCDDEPQCHTCHPRGGWPSEIARAALSGGGENQP